MGKESIGRLPKLGEITLPVHLKHYEDKENPKNYFQAGFAFMKMADHVCDVTDDDGKSVGSIGGTFGGHVEMTRYYPHGDRDNTGSANYKQWVNVIVDVRDIWEQIEKLLESKDVKVQFDGMEEVLKKYEDLKRKETNASLLRMEKRELEERKEKEDKKAAISKMISDIKQSKGIEETSSKDTYMVGNYEVIEDNGWDLTEEMEEWDVSFFPESGFRYTEFKNLRDGKIPVNLGCGIKVVDTSHDKRKGYYTDKVNKEDKEVTLDITSWIGISPGAIHYYGKLKFRAPYLHPDGEPNCSTSAYDLKLLGSGHVELTRKLEAWEFDKYPVQYDTYKEGDNYLGFYTEDDVIKRGKEMFEKLFGPGWKLKIDRY